MRQIMTGKMIAAVGTLLLSFMISTVTYALPALQLGPDTSDPDSWSYDAITETWVTNTTGTINIAAYANCQLGAAGCYSPHGDFAWDELGAADRYAYLVIAATPDMGDIGDLFDITVAGANLVNSGYGNPPLQDLNSLAAHGIYDTYFEIYEFMFDGPVQTIHNTQPDDQGSGDGYAENIGVTVDSLVDGVAGLHFDLFSVTGARWDPSDLTENKQLVRGFAPFSHDAEWVSVPEPGSFALMGIGLLGFLASRKYSKK